ncbi:MAG: hypothetical protein GY739_22275, partial [Mesoflavibacter sp.]|nr:hypothetical protein [Mesoflavibacter sp.]
MNKPIRYLGTWSTANGNTEKGLQLLKEKMEERLGRIQNSSMHAAAKVRSIRGRVISTWNYTAGVQQLDMEEIDKWEVKFREAILSKEFQISARKDWIYLEATKGGLGMTHLKEEYEQNILRTLAQIIESGERLKGRGQVPWTQKLLLEELQKTTPCLKIIEQMKELLTKLGLRLEKPNKKNKPWYMQEEEVVRTVRKKIRELPLYAGISEIGGEEIPVHIIEYFERNKGKDSKEEPWEEAIALQKRKREKIESLKEQG